MPSLCLQLHGNFVTFQRPADLPGGSLQDTLHGRRSPNPASDLRQEALTPGGRLAFLDQPGVFQSQGSLRGDGIDHAALFGSPVAIGGKIDLANALITEREGDAQPAERIGVLLGSALVADGALLTGKILP